LVITCLFIYLENIQMTKPLSPAAQAVVDAIDGIGCPQWIAEATLRAAADQVVPEQLTEPHGTGFRWGGWAAKKGVRAKLLAIAAELEGAND
jgi:hypothetical protein